MRHWLGPSVSSMRWTTLTLGSGRGESFRPAENREFYDWYLLLKFRGSRDECLRVLNALFSGAGHHSSPGADDFLREAPPTTIKRCATSYRPTIGSSPA